MASYNVVAKTSYNEVPATPAMRSIPRFGHSSDFAQLFSTNQQEQTDYAVGLIFIGGILAALFLVWWIILLILKCIPGTGFMGGAPFSNPSRGKRVRIAYIFFTVMSMLFTVLLVTEGITNLQDTINSASTGNQDINYLAREADRIASSLQMVGERSVSIRDTLVANLGNLCPQNSDLVATLGVDIEGEAQTAVDLLTTLSDFVQNELKDAQLALDNIQQATVDVDSTVGKIDMNDWQTLLVLIPWIIVPSMLVVGVLMAMCGVSIPAYDCFQTWVLLPLLISMTVCTLVLASLVSIVAVGNADFCSGGSQRTPDESVFEILNATSVTPDELPYKVVRFYVSQCLADDPFAFLYSYRSQIEEAEVSVQDLDTAIQSVGVTVLEQVCGGNIVDVASLTGVMLENLGVLRDSARDTIELLRCDQIVPIYINLVYDGTCTYSVKGVTWAFSAFLVVAFTGTILIMFRSSFRANDEDAVREDQFKSEGVYGEPVPEYAQEIDDHPIEVEYSTKDAERVSPVETFTQAETNDDDDVSEVSYSYSYVQENSVEYQYANAFDPDYARSNYPKASAPPDTVNL